MRSTTAVAGDERHDHAAGDLDGGGVVESCFAQAQVVRADGQAKASQMSLQLIFGESPGLVGKSSLEEPFEVVSGVCLAIGLSVVDLRVVYGQIR
jgi:hypothetical protein